MNDLLNNIDEIKDPIAKAALSKFKDLSLEKQVEESFKEDAKELYKEFGTDGIADEKREINYL